MRVRHRILGGTTLRCPLPGAGWALRQLPVVLEEIIEIAVVPLGRMVGPGAFEAAGEGVHAEAIADAVLPAQPHLLDGGGLGVGADILFLDRAMALAERMPTGDQRHRLLVVHRHARESLANIA